MTSLKVKAGTFIATSAFVLAFVPSAFAANVNVTVEGNGAKSNQTVVVKESSDTTVQQSNTTNVVNVQSASSSTGGNTVKNSTGDGENSIVTGDAKATNKLSVVGGSNTYVADNCGCEDSTTTVDVTGNGAHSKTKVKVLKSSTKTTKQKTKTNVYNTQAAGASTGENEVKNSTGGDGDTIYTGDATTKNTVVVESGSNFAGPEAVL